MIFRNQQTSLSISHVVRGARVFLPRNRGGLETGLHKGPSMSCRVLSELLMAQAPAAETLCPLL